MFSPTSEAAFGKGGILRLHFRKTGRHMAVLTLEQMCRLFCLKSAADRSNEQTKSEGETKTYRDTLMRGRGAGEERGGVRPGAVTKGEAPEENPERHCMISSDLQNWCTWLIFATFSKLWIKHCKEKPSLWLMSWTKLGFMSQNGFLMFHLNNE